MHGLLSWSSLLLPLPPIRNCSAPMIWPEFRFHSIVFTSRHVLCTLLTLNNAWPQSMVAHVGAKLAVLLATAKAADVVTSRLGDAEKRTTNAMPYPKTVSVEERHAVKFQYVSAQFGATAAACLPDATLSFVPLLAIQVAPLLMTLVRKGKIDGVSYHAV